MDASRIVVGEQWEIQYARLFNAPISSTFTRSSSLRNNQRKRRGTWLSSPSATAFLKLSTDEPISEIIIVISIGKSVQEEHVLRKLHFSWPHVSCVSGFPPRGCRVIFASYRDCDDLVQKFAMRFPSSNEIQIFSNALQKVMSGTDIVGPSNEIVYFPSTDYDSEISSQSDVALHVMSHRESEELSTMPPLSVDYSNSDRSLLINNLEPPSFSSLLTSNCCTSGGNNSEAAQSKTLPHSDLEEQITKYMEDSSFQDMINKVEKIITGMGYEEALFFESKLQEERED